MLPLCLILGDSTAVGTAAALAASGVRCEVHARVGARSSDLLKVWLGGRVPARVLIGLGSNDPGDPTLARNLVALRRRASSSQVTWLAPYDPAASRVVASVAQAFGDQVVYLAYQPTRDRLHPTSYRPIAWSLHWQDVSGVWKSPSIPFSVQPRVPLTPAPARRATVLVFDRD